MNERGREILIEGKRGGGRWVSRWGEFSGRSQRKEKKRKRKINKNNILLNSIGLIFGQFRMVPKNYRK